MAAMSARFRLNIVLAAEEGAGLRILKALDQSGHRIALVLTSPPGTHGSALWSYAEARGHPLLPASTVKDAALADIFRKEDVDLFLNVHSLHIVNGAILESPRIGAFNLHPGPLPRYAGLYAPGWAILRGERRYGVTVHRMLAGIDTGPIAYQTLFDLTESDTALSVGLRCVAEGLALLFTLVDAAALDPASIPNIEQDLTQREYFGRIIPEGGAISWDRPAADIDRMVRAFCYFPFPSPWGAPKTRAGDREIGIVKTSPTGEPSSAPPGTIAKISGDEAWVSCADAWLRLDLITVDGRRVAPAEALSDIDRLGG
ncbi:Methionyl-tRNA formyltransferase [Methylocaldum szegediense]|uniref:Methionyl-tRNA formyltransferase n=2 Tax=Methylocaldum szegediense TaxID=73780 RepID=A0ABN8X897_9GAMM|nr:Methionyl-tRNA formyltransferase [Methylocaldum szegediense]